MFPNILEFTFFNPCPLALYLNACLGLTIRPQFSDFVFTPAVEVKEGQWMASMGGRAHKTILK